MKKRKRGIWVVEFLLYDGSGEWDFCEPIIAHPLKVTAEREAEARSKKYPDTKYRAHPYMAKP